MSDHTTSSLKGPVVGPPFVRTLDRPDEGPWILELSDGQRCRIGRTLARALSLQAGDELWFPAGAPVEFGEPDLLDQPSVFRVRKAGGSKAAGKRPARTEIWYTAIGYVSEPKLDKQKRYFVHI